MPVWLIILVVLVVIVAAATMFLMAMSRPGDEILGGMETSRPTQIATLGTPRRLRDVKVPLVLDLNTKVPESTSDTSIEPVLRAIKGRSIDRPTIVTWRHNLNKVMEAPYGRRPWKIGVERVSDKLAVLHTIIDYDTHMNPIGFAFENAMCSGNSSHKTVVEWKRPDVDLIVGAEIDCVDGDGHNVELKLKSERGSVTPWDLLRYWIQSTLAGTDRLIVGHHDGHTVDRLTEYRVRDIPGLRDVRGRWRPEVCMQSLDRFVALVADIPVGSRRVVSFDPRTRRMVIV